ncbi:MAG TPA: BatA domain-containing protein, partial [Blastocatellia bacterium]|nr:BatA domain-containing protein [Blastocatellia bacterium]
MSFLNPLFLLGLAAVAAPIIVHLVRRTKAPRIEFPSLMFVRRVPQRTIRKRMVQNWLLLFLRCLAFLLLALAFVRPYFGSDAANNA